MLAERSRNTILDSEGGSFSQFFMYKFSSLTHSHTHKHSLDLHHSFVCLFSRIKTGSRASERVNVVISLIADFSRCQHTKLCTLVHLWIETQRDLHYAISLRWKVSIDRLIELKFSQYFSVEMIHTNAAWMSLAREAQRKRNQFFDNQIDTLIWRVSEGKFSLAAEFLSCDRRWKIFAFFLVAWGKLEDVRWLAGREWFFFPLCSHHIEVNDEKPCIQQTRKKCVYFFCVLSELWKLEHTHSALENDSSRHLHGVSTCVKFVQKKRFKSMLHEWTHNSLTYHEFKAVDTEQLFIIFVFLCVWRLHKLLKF